MNLLELLTKYFFNVVAAASAFVISVTSAALPSAIPSALSTGSNILQAATSNTQQDLQGYAAQPVSTPKSTASFSGSNNSGSSSSPVTVQPTAPASSSPTVITPVEPCMACPTGAEPADYTCQPTCTLHDPCPICKPYSSPSGNKPLMICPMVMCVPLGDN